MVLCKLKTVISMESWW